MFFRLCFFLLLAVFMKNFFIAIFVLFLFVFGCVAQAAFEKEEVIVSEVIDGDTVRLFDGERVQFRRLKYDFETTMEKILSIDQLDDMLGLRLKMGR